MLNFTLYLLVLASLLNCIFSNVFVAGLHIQCYNPNRKVSNTIYNENSD